MKQLDILFVRANSSQIIYQNLANDFAAKEPPQWAGMMANHVRTKGFSSSIIDAECERISQEETVSRIKDLNPRLVCFIAEGANPNASTQTMEGAVRTAEKLRQEYPQFKIIFGGQHVAALPWEVLERHSFVDFVLQNEGFRTISSLCAVEDLKDESLLGKVKGLGYRSKEGFNVLNEIGELIPEELLSTELPGIAWDLLPSFDKYRTSNWHSWTNNTEASPFASIYTTFGCKYKCDFCMINITNRTDGDKNKAAANFNVYREYDPKFIITQFDKFAMAGVKNVKIVDELFVYNPKHFLKVCDLLVERGYEFNIWAYSRIDTCKPEYLEKLKKAGINWLALGVENPQQVLRKEVHKGGFKDVKITDLFKTINDAGIAIVANYIFGLPMDTLESMQYTRDFMMENLTEYMNVYPAQAFPGSPLYLFAKEHNWQLPDSYSGYSMHSYDTQNTRTDKLTSAEILKFRDETINMYFTNEKYLKMMNEKYGKVCVDNLNKMMSHKLKRKILGD